MAKKILQGRLQQADITVITSAYSSEYRKVFATLGDYIILHITAKMSLKKELPKEESIRNKFMIVAKQP